MSEYNKQFRLNGGLAIFSLALIAIGAGIGAYLLMRGSETRESAEASNYSVSALSCESSSQEDAFFKKNGAILETHTIRITFSGGAASSISYSYNGIFTDENAAESAKSSLHADYNIYMGKSGLSPESLTPSFSDKENEAKVSLFSDVKKLNAGTAKFFFLDMEKYRIVNSSSEEELSKIYENDGFICSVKK